MRTAPPPLLPLFRSEMQVELLGLLLLQASRSWTLRELTRLLSAPESSVLRELRRAADAGLATRDTSQRPHQYAAATQTPAYQPLRELLDMTVGIPSRLRSALEDIDGVVAGSIHGSWAAGTPGPRSDLDVLVVTRGAPRPALEAVREVGAVVGREVDPSVMRPDQLAELMRARNPFLGKILHGPRIDFIGDLESVADAA